MIRKVVQQAFRSDYLSAEAESNIRQMYQNCRLEDIDALIHLQQALNYGYLLQESKTSGWENQKFLVSTY